MAGNNQQTADIPPQHAGVKANKPLTPGRLAKFIYRALSSQVGLIIILVLYTFIGAGIFMAIESPHESQEKDDILELRDEIITNVWNTSIAVKNSEESFRLLLQQELRKYESGLYDAFNHGINTDSDRKIWDFWGAFFYCATIYSTIGYGHIAPATTAGRIVTMIYAIIGIPLCLIVMADMGKLFTRGIKFLWAFVRRFYRTGHCRASSVQASDAATETPDGHIMYYGYRVDDEFNLPVPVAVVIGFIYIIVGAALYIQWEDWTYLEAFYFIFISISTIGFGDVLPEHPRYFLISSFYILVGLSLVAMIINVIMEYLSTRFEEAKAKMQEGLAASQESVAMATQQAVSQEQKQK